jgi:hypothetical protein
MITIKGIEIFLGDEQRLIDAGVKRDFDELIEMLLRNREIQYPHYLLIIKNKNTLLSQKRQAIIHIFQFEKGRAFINEYLSELKKEKALLDEKLKLWEDSKKEESKSESDKEEIKELSEDEIKRLEELEQLIFICEKKHR